MYNEFFNNYNTKGSLKNGGMVASEIVSDKINYILNGIIYLLKSILLM